MRRHNMLLLKATSSEFGYSAQLCVQRIYGLLAFLWLTILTSAVADNPDFGYIDVSGAHGIGVRLFDYPPVGDYVSGYEPLNCRNCSWALALRGVMAKSYIFTRQPPCRSSHSGVIVQMGVSAPLNGNPLMMRAGAINVGGMLAMHNAFRECFNDGSSLASGSAGSNKFVSITFEVQKQTIVTMVGFVVHALTFGGFTRPSGRIDGGGELIASFALNRVIGAGEEAIISRYFSIRQRLDGFESKFVLDPGTYRARFSASVHNGVLGVAGPPDIPDDSSTTVVGMAFGDTVAMFVIRHPMRVPEGYSAYQVLRADVNNDGCIDDSDFLHILLNYGRQFVYINEDSANDGIIDENDVIVDLEGISADVNFDGVVDDSDLLQILMLFGHCYLE